MKPARLYMFLLNTTHTEVILVSMVFGLLKQARLKQHNIVKPHHHDIKMNVSFWQCDSLYIFVMGRRSCTFVEYLMEHLLNVGGGVNVSKMLKFFLR